MAHLSIVSRVTYADQQILTGVTRSGGPLTRIETRTCVGIRRLTAYVGVHPALMPVYITGEMIIGYHNPKGANRAMPRTAAGRRGCNRRASWTGLLTWVIGGKRHD